jgi:hypothetical protein
MQDVEMPEHFQQEIYGYSDNLLEAAFALYGAYKDQFDDQTAVMKTIAHLLSCAMGMSAITMTREMAHDFMATLLESSREKSNDIAK